MTANEALSRLARLQGDCSSELFRHGTLQLKVYAPIGADPQSPHSRDEAYIVIRGEGTFVSDAGRHAFGPGDFLFAPAGVSHRFEDFSQDFAVWVIFYGPDGGEKSSGGRGPAGAR